MEQTGEQGAAHPVIPSESICGAVGKYFSYKLLGVSRPVYALVPPFSVGCQQDHLCANLLSLLGVTRPIYALTPSFLTLPPSFLVSFINILHSSVSTCVLCVVTTGFA